MRSASSRYEISQSKWVSIASIMTSLALAGSYALVAIPNVELGSTVLFITAYFFGTTMGIWSAVIMSIIFASVNPWGGFIPQIWVSQLIGWLYMVVAGGLMGYGEPGQSAKALSRAELLVAGAFLTAIFDMVTNIGWALISNQSYYIVILVGLPFMVAHVVSNALIFALVVERIEPIIRRDLASQIWRLKRGIVLDIGEE